MSTLEEFGITVNKLEAAFDEKRLLHSSTAAVLMRESALKDMQDENIKKIKSIFVDLKSMLKQYSDARSRARGETK